MTTRRWMLAVAATAFFSALCIQVQKWWRLQRRHARALRDCSTSAKWYYEEGRITYQEFMSVSERLMETELDLSSRRDHQIRAIMDHLRRVSQIIDEERECTTICRGINLRDATLIEDSLENSKAVWGTWIADRRIDVLLDQCKVKVQKLREAN